MRSRGGWVCVLFFFIASGFAQQDSSAERSETPVSVSSGDRLFILDVVVTDKSGKPIAGLEPRDFTLFDNKRPAKILSFKAATIRTEAADPAEVVFVVDEINTEVNALATARLEIERYLQRDAGSLSRPALLAFASDTTMTFGQRHTRDGNALLADLNARELTLRDIGRAQGTEGRAERMQLSFDALRQLVRYEAPVSGHKLVIWIGPGWPFLEEPTLEQQTAKEKQGIFDSIVSASDALRLARITVYSVDPLGTVDAASFEGSTYPYFMPPVKAAKRADYGNLGLQILAAQSGGLVLFGSNDIAGEIAKCVADTNAFYVLSFRRRAWSWPQ